MASNSDYPHLLYQDLFKGCPAHFSYWYLDTESWCFVYAYIIHKATAQALLYKGTMKVFPLPRSATLFDAEENIPLVFLF